MKKRLLLLLTVILVATTFTACMAPQAPLTVLALDDTKAIPSAETYEKNLDGLVSYMKDSQVISGDGLDMSYGVIGAIGGKKFTFSYAEASVSCELYEFDIKNLDEKAQQVIDSVRAKGSFEALDKEAKAVLSENGQFMMLYVTRMEQDQDKALDARAKDAFQKFA